MPIYEYRCQDCGNDFEYMQRMSEDPKSVCESCGGALERLISRSAFHFKGGGWYKDLYASPKPEAASSAAKSDSGADKSSADTGSGSSKESKSAGESSTSSTSTKSSSTSTAPGAAAS